MTQKIKLPDIEALTLITQDQIENMGFECALEKLEEVVEALEQEGTPLAVGLKLYEIGTALSKRCSSILDSIEAKMVQIKLEGDIKKEEPFDIEKDGR